jgi:hypothetical protein
VPGSIAAWRPGTTLACPFWFNSRQTRVRSACPLSAVISILPDEEVCNGGECADLVHAQAEGRAVGALRLAEREEISRGIAAGRSLRFIAQGLGRSGGCSAYRPVGLIGTPGSGRCPKPCRLGAMRGYDGASRRSSRWSGRRCEYLRPGRCFRPVNERDRQGLIALLDRNARLMEYLNAIKARPITAALSPGALAE